MNVSVDVTVSVHKVKAAWGLCGRDHCATRCSPTSSTATAGELHNATPVRTSSAILASLSLILRHIRFATVILLALAITN
jgi:hypothetical protein